jgi:hypothetical protein
MAEVSRALERALAAAGGSGNFSRNRSSAGRSSDSSRDSSPGSRKATAADPGFGAAGEESKGLQHAWFDFHAECKGPRWHAGLAKLTALAAPAIAADGLFTLRRRDAARAEAASERSTEEAAGEASGRWAVSRQRGVVRTNCVDCLDRTNVAQAELARLALAAQLQSLGLLSFRLLAAQDGPAWGGALASTFRSEWGDHGDSVSRLYAGTGALKRDFTRTGKRTASGVVSDGVNSAARWDPARFFSPSPRLPHRRLSQTPIMMKSRGAVSGSFSASCGNPAPCFYALLVLRYFLNHLRDPARQEGLDLLLGGRFDPRCSSFPPGYF